MWSRDQRVLFAKNYTVTAKMYDKSLDFDVCQFTIDDLQDLDFQKCLESLVIYRKNSKNKTWPKASDIRAIVDVYSDTSSSGKLIAASILEAVSLYGYSNSNKAKSHIGDLGWKAVSKFGGWEYLCNNLGVNINVGTFNAQIREICIALTSTSLSDSALLIKVGLDIKQIGE